MIRFFLLATILLCAGNTLAGPVPDGTFFIHTLQGSLPATEGYYQYQVFRMKDGSWEFQGTIEADFAAKQKWPFDLNPVTILKLHPAKKIFEHYSFDWVEKEKLLAPNPMFSSGPTTIRASGNSLFYFDSQGGFYSLLHYDKWQLIRLLAPGELFSIHKDLLKITAFAIRDRRYNAIDLVALTANNTLHFFSVAYEGVNRVHNHHVHPLSFHSIASNEFTEVYANGTHVWFYKYLRRGVTSFMPFPIRLTQDGIPERLFHRPPSVRVPHLPKRIHGVVESTGDLLMEGAMGSFQFYRTNGGQSEIFQAPIPPARPSFGFAGLVELSFHFPDSAFDRHQFFDKKVSESSCGRHLSDHKLRVGQWNREWNH